MTRAPRSLLVRTFLLLVGVVALTTFAWLAIFRLAEAEPRARELGQLTASVVNLTRSALIAAKTEKRRGLLSDLAAREGIGLLPAEDDDEVEAPPNDRFFELVQQEIRQRLGPATRIALRVNDTSGFWVSFHLDASDDEYWIMLPKERTRRTVALGWLGWGLLALTLALAAAWLIASRITRPLTALATAADRIGRGEYPPPLTESGADELRRLTLAFNQMSHDLARNEQERAEVLAGISHDLRTPLARMRLEAEMSLDGPALTGMVADIEQMDAIIAQFLIYARGEAGEAEQPTDPSQLLRNVVDHQQAVGRKLHFQLPDNLPLLPLRPQALQRAVTNLLDNAWKYGAEPIELRAGVEDGRLRIDVLDRGAGVPAQEVERLMRPFTRLENARSNASGTGLGLAIVKRVAQLHGGALQLQPRQDGGLLARLELPLPRQAAPR